MMKQEKHTVYPRVPMYCDEGIFIFPIESQRHRRYIIRFRTNIKLGDYSISTLFRLNNLTLTFTKI